MRKFKLLIMLVSVFTLFGVLNQEKAFADDAQTFKTEIIAVATDEITPNKTSYGNGGYTKIEIYSNGYEVWWSVKPNTTKSYTYQGLVTVTYTNNSTQTFWVSKSGSGGKSVSGTISLSKKAKNAGISGVAYGPGGIQISIPTID